MCVSASLSEFEFCSSLSAALGDLVKSGANVSVSNSIQMYSSTKASFEGQFFVWMFLRQVRLRLERVPGMAPLGISDDRVEDSVSWEVEHPKELVSSLLQADLPNMLVQSLWTLTFEARKDGLWLLLALLRCGAIMPELRDSMLSYIQAHPDMLRLLLQGCWNPEVGHICGDLLRECSRDPELVALLLEDFNAGVELVAAAQDPNFDVSCEAFSALHEILLTQKVVAARYLRANFSGFFSAFNGLLQDQNYVTKRLALRLLGELLLDASFAEVMLLYVRDDGFLRLHMNLLLDPSPKVQLGAFHVLKLFVANPAKPSRVETILRRNAIGLRECVALFPRQQPEDEALTEDARTVCEIIFAMSPVGASQKPL